MTAVCHGAVGDVAGCVRRGDSGAYPSRLEGLASPPENLYVRGDATCLIGPCVAVVGTRKASATGREYAASIGHRIASEGVVVISGLAEGVDGAAHRGAIASGGRTAAVLAQGLDTTIYPRGHATLALDVYRTGGCLVTEYEPHTPPDGHRFVERDRIQAGLSQAVVLVESAHDSGSFHAIRAARDMGRPVFAVYSETAASFDRRGAARARDEFGATIVRTMGDLVRAVLELTRAKP